MMPWRFALKQYIVHPERTPASQLIYYNDKVSIINDGFPKSICHLLVMPRDSNLTKKHPTVSLTEDIKAELWPYVEMAQNHIFETFTNEYELVEPIPNCFETIEDFRDKETFINNFIQVGVHSVPSMGNLHIHVITKDFHSDNLKRKNHYISFTTTFFKKWEELPLSEIPDRDYMINEVIKHHDLICSYCGKNFFNKFAKLKSHLDDEFTLHFKKKN